MKRILLIFSLSVLFLVPQNVSAMAPEHPRHVSALDLVYLMPIVVIPLSLVQTYEILKKFVSGVSSPHEYAPLTGNPVEQNSSCKKLYLVHRLLELVRERLLALSEYDSRTLHERQRLWVAINIAMVLLSGHGESAQLSLALYYELLEQGTADVRLCVVRGEHNGHTANHAFLVLADGDGRNWAMDPYLNAMMIPLNIYWTDPRFLLHFRSLLLDPNWVVSQESAAAFSMQDADLNLLSEYVNYLRGFENDEQVLLYVSTLNEVAGVKFDSNLKAGKYDLPDGFNSDESGESSKSAASFRFSSSLEEGRRVIFYKKSVWNNAYLNTIVEQRKKMGSNFGAEAEWPFTVDGKSYSYRVLEHTGKTTRLIQTLVGDFYNTRLVIVDWE